MDTANLKILKIYGKFCFLMIFICILEFIFCFGCRKDNKSKKELTKKSNILHWVIVRKTVPSILRIIKN